MSNSYDVLNIQKIPKILFIDCPKSKLLYNKVALLTRTFLNATVKLFIIENTLHSFISFSHLRSLFVKTAWRLLDCFVKQARPSRRINDSAKQEARNFIGRQFERFKKKRK